MADPSCVARLIEELAIVQPKILVVMGEDALGTVNELEVPLAEELSPRAGRAAELHPGDPGPVHAQHRRGAG